MDATQETISKIVKEVLNKYQLIQNNGHVQQAGIFRQIGDAVEAARSAQESWVKLSLEQRKNVIEEMRRAATAHAQELAELAVAETGLGNVESKIAKNILVAAKTPGMEDLQSTAFTGDHGLTLVEMAPYGVIGSITPSTNPAATIINNAIAMLSAGNSVVFNPHPGARQVSSRTVEILNQAIIAQSGPDNLLCSVQEPSLASAQEIMQHPGVRLLVVTGGPEVVKAAMASGKKCIAAGPGNPPVVVDETADLVNAARNIIYGASFDHNIICVDEKEVFAVDSIFSDLKKHMKTYGGYELTAPQFSELEKRILTPGNPGKPYKINREFIGKSPQLIAKSIGLDLPRDTKLLFAETDCDHPLVQLDQLMPVLPLVRTHDVEEAIQSAVKAEGGRWHSAVMHSRNVENLSNMAYRIKTTIFTKNAPAISGLGYQGEGHTTMTIAGPTGEGITSPRSYTRQRRCVLVDYFRII